MATLAESALGSNTTLENLQTDEQRRVLDTVSQVRKCGLESVLSLPQIVVCGDQSAGKSSLLEALTEIPFPRNDNLCTRFATEISLRREPENALTIRIIPDSARPEAEQEEIMAYTESITDFKELPSIMSNAMKVMGISETANAGSAFARDTLSIAIQGPDRPQLTLVDIPGLIQASTKGVSEADVAMVAEITNSYIQQPRTICLAVVSATHDAANQPILQRVRKFDPLGERTLGVITKPDRLSPGSGSEEKFLELALNKDVFFKLGWHVIKNRKFEESEYSIEERNMSEKTFFRTSKFSILPDSDVGIDALRVKLSHVLFDHVKKELPRLQEDLETALKTASKELQLLGEPRSTVAECRAFLGQLSMTCHEICKAALTGHYEHDYFKEGARAPFSLKSKSTIARIRAAVQHINTEFEAEFRRKGHKYHLQLAASGRDAAVPSTTDEPQVLSRAKAMAWVKERMLHSRGTELIGNFNPLLIAELFWEQSEGWGKLARSHVEKVSKLCESFLSDLLDHIAPKDLKERIWLPMIFGTLKKRRESAFEELKKLLDDKKDFPINYNHYYTDTIHKKRHDRIGAKIQKHVKEIDVCPRSCSLGSSTHFTQADMDETVESLLRFFADKTPTSNMEEYSCEEALDGMLAIYKVQQKVFVANVVTQVIERHMARGLQDVFSPLVVMNLPSERIQSIVAEPRATSSQRKFLADRIKKLEDGQEIFRDMMGGV